MERRKILTIANFVERKRIDLCARTCARLEKKSDIEWAVLGQGPLLEKMKEIAPASMKFVGRVENLVPFYREADLFVLPSKDEGFGMVYVEAIMCGCPVICRKDDGGEEIVETTGGGIAVELPDKDDETAVGNIENAAEEILGNREKYMSPEIIERARSLVDPVTIKEKWLALLSPYEEVTAKM
jgi:glycosyltransferase involved in cell wall biosynthesis